MKKYFVLWDYTRLFSTFQVHFSHCISNKEMQESVKSKPMGHLHFSDVKKHSTNQKVNFWGICTGLAFKNLCPVTVFSTVMLLKKIFLMLLFVVFNRLLFFLKILHAKNGPKNQQRIIDWQILEQDLQAADEDHMKPSKLSILRMPKPTS